MVAGVQEHDKPVYHAKPAWHGLGLVVEEAPTPREALTMAGLDWGVGRKELFYKDENGNDKKVESHVMNIREDVNYELGVVSSKFVPIQNVDMADFCEALLESKDVKCESVGSLWNGGRVWFLLKGAEFNIVKEDRMFPYICVSNGHDGGSAFRVTPTTVRVVCSNTLHMVIPNYETGDLGNAAVSFRHTTNIMERVEQAKNALQNYGRALDETKKLGQHLASKDVKKEDLEKFFLEVYTTEFTDIPANPKDAWEERRRNKALSAMDSFGRRFDDEVKVSGANAWTMFNAFSGLVQHDQKARGKDDAARVATRIERNLFGLGQDRTMTALRQALTMAG